MRLWSVSFSLALAGVALPTLATAEVGGGTIEVELKIPDNFTDDEDSDVASNDETDYRAPSSDEERYRYFNRARCLCDKAGVTQQFLAQVTWATQPTSPSGQLPVYTGSMCTDLELREVNCKLVGDAIDAAVIDETVYRFERVGDLLSPSNDDCSASVTQATYGIYSTTTGNDLTEETTASFGIDLLAPEVPTTVDVVALENAIRVEWDELSAPEDYAYFQALCANLDGTAVHDEPTDSAQYDAVSNICGEAVETMQPFTVANADDLPAVDGTPPAGLLTLDDAYVCGEVASGSATSIEISGLENDVPYWVVVVAVDKYGNYTARYVPSVVTPKPVTDFWEYLNDEDPEVSGGFCLLESTFGAGGGSLYPPLRAWRDQLGQSAIGRWWVDRYYRWGAPVAAAARDSLWVRIGVGAALLPLVVIALAWHALSLPGLLAAFAALVLWRRHRRRRVAALAFALAASAPALAAAQTVAPYWENEQVEETAPAATSRWRLGLRMGPFLPSIDAPYDSPGPYQRTFDDGDGLLPMFDAHRLFPTRFGQLGLGLSAGYFGQDAAAYVPGQVDEDGEPLRSDENRTYFRLVPVELTAVYRATQLDDAWGIPLVPYLRGGLAYYIWWMNRPDGETSEACDDDGANCDTGRGASLGWVAAAGLSIRAERIDRDAARSMTDSGIEHAGFYAEVTTATVDGFGNAEKLSLGDTTWFAGIDFEF